MRITGMLDDGPLAAEGGRLTALMRVAILALLALVLRAPPAAAQASIYKVIYSFGATPTDGASPKASLLAAPGHVFYGTTTSGGVNGAGTAFELDAPRTSNGPWTETTLHSFGATGDLTYPQGPVVADAAGVLYGVAVGGLYSLTPPAVSGGAWTETFVDSVGTPVGGLFIDKNGILYGEGDGVASNTVEVFGQTTPLANSRGQVLYTTTGYTNSGQLLGTPDGLYGITWTGGDLGGGSVFQVAPPRGPSGSFCVGGDFQATTPSEAAGAWFGTTIYSFPIVDDGSASQPVGRLARDRRSCVLYGALAQGDAAVCGSVYALTPPAAPNGAWSETVLHGFAGADGCLPFDGVILSDGVLYGTTTGGGANNLGTVFSLRPPVASGDAWTYAILHSFSGGVDGADPTAALTMARGVLFGTTRDGGANGMGTIFALRP